MARSRKQQPQKSSISVDSSYPRPLLERKVWRSLDGPWDFALDADRAWTDPDQVEWSTTIFVPFSPETPASGVEAKGFFKRCWYRRRVKKEEVPEGEQILLHFGAVDYSARVFINGDFAVEHEGGYLPFEVDVTRWLNGDSLEVVVCADDDPHDLAKPRGKQDWLEHAHSIWYPRTTGIWQTVWLEGVPRDRICSLQWTPCLARGEVRFVASIDSSFPRDLRLRVKLEFGSKVLCEDLCSVGEDGAVERSFPVCRSGAEDFAVDVLWTPEDPKLISAHLTLETAEGVIRDEVESYTALRAVGIDGDRFVLNRRPRLMRLVLHQGFWPDSGLTPPDGDAYRRDIELIKSLGFDGVRMHQKVESPRFLAWADRLGLLVWEEMPSPYVFSNEAVRRSLTQWAQVIERDISHPCIVTWVPTNESWGAPDLPIREDQRCFVRSMYEMTKALDPTRPVVGNDGWEMNASDITAIHDYDGNPEGLLKRYRVGSEAELIENLKRERPGHRRIILEDYEPRDRPVMLTEFGGIACSERAGDWGYKRAQSTAELIDMYRKLLTAVRSIPILAGWCFTQFTDTYQEANGLVRMDRTPKGNPHDFWLANRG